MYVQLFNAYLSGALEFIIEGYNRINFFYCRKMSDQNVREPEEPAGCTSIWTPSRFGPPY